MQYWHFQIPNIPNISANYICLMCYCCIMIGSDKTKCCKCSSEVKNGDSICCSICNVWHHLHCSGLSREEFLQHIRNKNLYWECPKCVVYRCGKCSRFLGKCGCILWMVPQIYHILVNKSSVKNVIQQFINFWIGIKRGFFIEFVLKI